MTPANRESQHEACLAVGEMIPNRRNSFLIACTRFTVRVRCFLFLVLLITVAAACARRPLNEPDAQRAIDQWVTARSQRDGLTAEILKQSFIDAEVSRKESYGIEVSDAEYSQLQAKAPSSVTIKILGIRELPAENRAVADLDLRGFAWRQGGRIHRTTLPGVAHFSYYSDGRWVFSSIEWEQGLAKDSPNIPVR